MQSFFIGIGAAVANALPEILGKLGVTGNAANGVPLAVQYSFKLGAAGSMQSFFIGIGAAVANALPEILGKLGVTGNAANGVPLAVQYSFKLGAAVFLLAVLWTVFTSKEYPPENMEEFLRKKQIGRAH